MAVLGIVLAVAMGMSVQLVTTEPTALYYAKPNSGFRITPGGSKTELEMKGRPDNSHPVYIHMTADGSFKPGRIPRDAFADKKQTTPELDTAKWDD